MEYRTFFGCPLCPNKVFTSQKAVDIHTLKHEDTESPTSDISKYKAHNPVPKVIHLKSSTLFTNEVQTFQSKVGNLINNRPHKRISQEEVASSSKRHKKLVGTNVKTLIDKSVINENSNVKTLVDKSVIIENWECKFCTTTFFDSLSIAEKHVEETHLNLKKEDLMIHIQKRKMKKGNLRITNKYVCKICKQKFFNENKVGKHLLKHNFVYDDEEKSVELIKTALIISVFKCNLCGKKMQSTDAITHHAWEKHIKNTIKEVEVTIPTDETVIIVRDLLKKVGITESRKVSGLQKRNVCEIPDVVYSCCLCPHLALFCESQVEKHMTKRHNLADYSTLISTVPTQLLIEDYGVSSNGHKNARLSCLCRYATFSKEILSMPIIDSTYEELVSQKKIDVTTGNYNNTNLNAETKLSRIYQHQFICHNKHKLLINPNKKTKRERKLKVGNKYTYNFISYATKETANTEHTEITTNEDVILVRELVKRAGITDYSKTSSMQTRIVKEVPEELYCCCLCPHLAMFSKDDAKLHLNAKHNLTEEYSMLISTVAIQLVMRMDEDGVVLPCLCKYATFNKDVLSMSVIDRTYKEILQKKKQANKDDDIDAVTKLLTIYEWEFISHNPHKLIVVPKLTGRKRKISENENTPFSLKTCKLEEN